MKNFGAVFICKLNGEEFTASNRTDMDEMLEKASAEHLMDDNDDTILDIKCTFKNKYQNEKMKKFRTGASIAADNVMKTLKNWVEKATNRSQVKDADQYVIVDGDGKAENLQSRSPDNWADRFVCFLFMPEKMHEHHKAKHQNPSKKAFDLKETIDAITLDAVEGFARVFDLIDEAVAHKEAAHMARAEEWKLNKGKPVSNDLEQVENLDVGVEILLEDDAEKTPEEWKIYFSKNSDDESLSNDVGLLDDESLSNDVVLLEIPVADDVISISSDDTLATDNFMHVHGGDDDSWTLLDDE